MADSHRPFYYHKLSLKIRLYKKKRIVGEKNIKFFKFAENFVV